MKKISKKALNKRNNSKPKIENRGKPSQLKHTKLKVPKIWTNQIKCVYLVKYLTDNGRHNFLHQAGKHSNKTDNNQKQQNDQNIKIYYEYAQEIAEKLFKIQCVSMRCIVFFFRDINEDKSDFNFSEYIQNQEYLEVLYDIQPLLSETFIKDLISILCSQNNVNSLVDMLCQSKGDPSQNSQIVQNCFIQQKLHKMIEEKKARPEIEIVKNEFEDFLKDPSTRYLIGNFIAEILSIFQAPKMHQSVLDEQPEVAEVDDFNNLYQ